MGATLSLFIYLFFVKDIGLSDFTEYLKTDVEAMVLWLFALLEPSRILSGVELNVILVTLIFILAAIAVLARLRWRLRNSERLTSTHCPTCSFPLSRIKRKNWQRSISRLMPFRRFYCKRCDWKGLKIKSNENVPLDTGQSYHNSRTRTRGIQHLD